PDRDTLALARDAAERLASAGRRAFARGDFGAAASLTARAVRLLDADDAERPALLVDLAEAACECGRFGEAEAALAAAAATSADGRARTMAALGLYRLQIDTDAAIDLDEAEREARRAVEEAEASGDDAAATAAWRLLFHVDVYRCR